jgi:predicted outer membrane lipoprotein
MTEELIFVLEEKDGKAKKRGCLLTFGTWILSIFWLGWLSKRVYPDSQITEWVTLAAWAVVIFLAPAFGILQAFDLKDHLDMKDEKSVFCFLWRLLILIGFWLSALVATGTGMMLLGSAIYSWIHEGRSGETILLIAFSMPFIALGLFLFWKPFSKKSASLLSAEMIMKMAEERAQRLVSPNFEGIRQQAGLKLPDLYQSLFAQDSEWLSGEWILLPEGEDGESYTFDELIPAHPDALRASSSLPGVFLAFATGEDSEYWIQLGPEDPPVFSHSLEEEESDNKICEKLSTFLQWPKEDPFA